MNSTPFQVQKRSESLENRISEKLRPIAKVFASQIKSRQSLDQLRKYLRSYYQSMNQKCLSTKKSDSFKRSATKAPQRQGNIQKETAEDFMDSPSKRVIKSYPIEFKLQIIQEVKKTLQNKKMGLAKAQALKAKEHKIPLRNLYRWWNQFESKRSKKVCQLFLKSRWKKTAKYPELENELLTFIEQNPDRKKHQIIQKAKEIYHRFNFSVENSHSDVNGDFEFGGDRARLEFHFSEGWYSRFRKRNRKRLQDLEGRHRKPNSSTQVVLKSQIDGQQFPEKMDAEQDSDFIEPCKKPNARKFSNDSSFLNGIDLDSSETVYFQNHSIEALEKGMFAD